MTIPPTSSTGVSPQVSQQRQMKVEDFINLMVTQLQNQDPLEPTKNGQLLTQMSQIGQLQSSHQTQEALRTLVLQSNLGSAGNLIGKLVQGINGTGDEVSGVVTSIRQQDGEVWLELDNGSRLSLSRVTEISEVAVGGSDIPAEAGTP